MKKGLATAFAVGAMFLLPHGQALAEEDTRQLIKVDEATQQALFKQMRKLVEHLDDIMAALAKGDFKTVVRIGEINLGFGHEKLEAMVAAGASEEEIQAMRERIRKKREARAKGGGGKHAGGGGGIGRKMTPEFRMMGQAMHKAAEEMAAAARKVSEPPTVEDYKVVLGKVQEVTSACRACHASFRVR